MQWNYNFIEALQIKQLLYIILQKFELRQLKQMKLFLLFFISTVSAMYKKVNCV